jgi:hypothetical protein
VTSNVKKKKKNVFKSHARLHRQRISSRLSSTVRLRSTCRGEAHQLGFVKDCGTLVDAVQRELVLQLLGGEDLLFTAVIPPQQAEEIHHGGGQAALLPELTHGGGAVPLGELGLVGSQDETHVCKIRRLPVKGIVDQHLRISMGTLDSRMPPRFTTWLADLSDTAAGGTCR